MLSNHYTPSCILPLHFMHYKILNRNSWSKQSNFQRLNFLCIWVFVYLLQIICKQVTYYRYKSFSNFHYESLLHYQLLFLVKSFCLSVINVFSASLTTAISKKCQHFSWDPTQVCYGTLVIIPPFPMRMSLACGGNIINDCLMNNSRSSLGED